MSETQYIKVNNAIWLGTVGPLIEKYFKKIGESGVVRGITYETLYTYFAQVVQFGGVQAEFLVAVNDNTPVAFASWRIAPIPHIGTVVLDHIYCDLKNHDTVLGFITRFIEFAENNKARFLMFDTVNDKVANIAKRIADETNITVEDTGSVRFIGRKKNG